MYICCIIWYIFKRKRGEYLAGIQLVDVRRQVRFLMYGRYRCSHCRKKNKTESIHETFRDYDKETEQLWGTCLHCGMDFQIQGKAIIRKAAVQGHEQCRCGRHFLFHLE